ncbi:MAG: hypothetical protein GF346_05405, partial [Candidatus Eisenbacteria bacterium]|nr:hypothetical protein [Candidatus Latescibacterota bacterium]MBD3301864.1 hypothetical protein [Candidatus Eisenbacteria bacterium]
LPEGPRPASFAPESILVDRIRSHVSRTGSEADPDSLAAGLPVPDSTWVRSVQTGARQARLIWTVPLGAVARERFPAVRVWNAGVNDAIAFQLREREGLAYSIGSSVRRLDDGTVLWSAGAGCATENLARILEGFAQELERATRSAPDSLAVARQGVQLYGRSLMRRATRMNRAYAAGLAVLDGRDPGVIDREIRAPMEVRRENVESVLPELRATRPGLVVVAY